MQSCIARDRDRAAIISRPSADCRCPRPVHFLRTCAPRVLRQRQLAATPGDAPGSSRNTSMSQGVDGQSFCLTPPPPLPSGAVNFTRHFLWTFGLAWYLSFCCRELGKVRLNSIIYLSMSIKIPRSIEIERARKQASSLARETQVVRAGTCPSQEHN